MSSAKFAKIVVEGIVKIAPLIDSLVCAMIVTGSFAVMFESVGDLAKLDRL